MDDRTEFRPRDGNVMRAWGRAMEVADMDRVDREAQRQIIQDAMRAIWPDLLIADGPDGWIVYRDGRPLA